jgi:hypothetical protein
MGEGEAAISTLCDENWYWYTVVFYRFNSMLTIGKIVI